MSQWLVTPSEHSIGCAIYVTSDTVPLIWHSVYRFVQSNAYKSFLERGQKIKYNEFGTARSAMQSLPIIASGLLGIGQGKHCCNNAFYALTLDMSQVSVWALVKVCITTTTPATPAFNLSSVSNQCGHWPRCGLLQRCLLHLDPEVLSTWTSSAVHHTASVEA